jgi:hypothetical protein
VIANATLTAAIIIATMKTLKMLQQRAHCLPKLGQNMRPCIMLVTCNPHYYALSKRRHHCQEAHFDIGPCGPLSKRIQAFLIAAFHSLLSGFGPQQCCVGCCYHVLINTTQKTNVQNAARDRTEGRKSDHFRFTSKWM